MYKRLCWCRKLISYVCDSFTFKVCFKELGFYYLLYEKISASNNVILKNVRWEGVCEYYKC